jgi:predicted RNase H-like HicB family nuclease
MKYKIKLIFDQEENEYVVFIDGVKGFEGRGETELEAIEDFKKQYENGTK